RSAGLFRSNSLLRVGPLFQTKSYRFDLFQRLHAVLQEASVTAIFGSDKRGQTDDSHGATVETSDLS
ncbi:MAG: hypothetical protein WCA10_07370, partial [Terracidiphilus sp.]